jgi:hypothetical protein
MRGAAGRSSDGVLGTAGPPGGELVAVIPLSAPDVVRLEGVEVVAPTRPGRPVGPADEPFPRMPSRHAWASV